MGCSSSTPPDNGSDSGTITDTGTGGPDGSMSADTGNPNPDSSAMDAALGPYPSGPYGTMVGSILANMTWIGYVDDAADAIATTKPYVMYSLDDARKSGKKYLMINLSETFCPGCQKSANEIKTGGAAVVTAGGVLIELLETTGFTTQASHTDLDNWVNKYSLPVTSMKDPDGTGTPSLNTLGPREHAYIVEMPSMKILQIIFGDYSGVGATSGGKGIAAMHVLLGK
jgi:hypothetical protein